MTAANPVTGYPEFLVDCVVAGGGNCPFTPRGDRVDTAEGARQAQSEAEGVDAIEHGLTLHSRRPPLQGPAKAGRHVRPLRYENWLNVTEAPQECHKLIR